MWGPLPIRYHFDPDNHRWSLGSYHLCFKNRLVQLLCILSQLLSSYIRLLSTYFFLGQVLPTHRHAHTAYGGLFQPTMTQAIRLLSRPPSGSLTQAENDPLLSPLAPSDSSYSPAIFDPFSDPHMTYTTTGLDTFPAPSSYLSRSYSWIHIFPEGRVHQHPKKTMRYFKWGIARLILEPPECPDVIPIWIEGNDSVMHESREWPRFVPRVGKTLGVWFGDNVGGDNGVFTEIRSKWKALVAQDRRERRRLLVEKSGEGPMDTYGWENYDSHEDLGILSERLKYSKEAVDLRIECTKMVRREVLRIRRLRGLPDEDPKEGLVETWIEESSPGQREGQMGDGSWVKEE